MNANNYSREIQDILKIAKEQALTSESKYVDLHHLLYAMIFRSNSNVYKILVSIGCEITDFKKELNELFFNQNQLNSYSSSHVPLSKDSDSTLRYSIEEAKVLGYNKVDDRHLFLALVKHANKDISNLFSKFSINYNLVLSFVPKKNDKNKSTNKKKAVYPTLEIYARNITEMAKNGALDPVIGRVDEIDRLAQILSRRKKNNPVLIGEPGVGKTAIVEGLALRIISKKVPRILWGQKIFALDLAGLIAGTKYRGQFEERMKTLMLELESADDIIVFIDELHTLVGAGSATGSLDAANLFKPGLARGEIQIIGATTLNEYRQHIEKDGALERRFQKIIINPPTQDDTIKILNGIKAKYESHHHVKYSKKAINACVYFSERYITDKFLPDKAIDILDEVGATISINNVKMPDSIIKLENKIKSIIKQKELVIATQQFEKAADLRDKERKLTIRLKKIQSEYIDKNDPNNWIDITEDDVVSVVSLITGIPLSKVAESETDRLLNMELVLNKSIKGQNIAIKKLSKAILRARAGLKNPTKPIGSFMFLGPTGVGKTELAKVLSNYLFTNNQSFIRIDMSEYMERYNISRLLGAPPGYVGYEEGGQLTEKVRRYPYSVVLFDEIEKGHPDIFNILLQILDDGRITDSLSRTIDFRNTIIIMTSNLGSNKLHSSNFGFMNDGDVKLKEKEIMSYVKKFYKPEFLNRIDDLIIFNSLEKEDLYNIIDLQLDDLKTNLSKKNNKLNFYKTAKELLLIDTKHREWGARPLRRNIQNLIENSISEMFISGEFLDEAGTISVKASKGSFIFSQTLDKSKKTTKKKNKPAKKSAIN